MADPQTRIPPGQIPGMAAVLQAPTPIDSVLKKVYSKYPILEQFGFEIVDSRNRESEHGGKLEFYHPLESRSPNPGVPTIELFSGIKGENLPTAVFGDMLHYLPDVMPEFEQKRRQFENTITDRQHAVDRKAYQRAVRDGETRPFPKWFETSRLDAYIRGSLAPDRDNEWENIYSNEQKQILNEMKALLE